MCHFFGFRKPFSDYSPHIRTRSQLNEILCALHRRRVPDVFAVGRLGLSFNDDYMQHEWRARHSDRLRYNFENWFAMEKQFKSFQRTHKMFKRIVSCLSILCTNRQNWNIYTHISIDSIRSQFFSLLFRERGCVWAAVFGIRAAAAFLALCIQLKMTEISIHSVPGARNAQRCSQYEVRRTF